MLYDIRLQAEKKAPGIIKQEAKQKLQKLKEKQAPALLLIEIFFIATVIIALRAFFDPGIELIPWSRVGIGPPITTIASRLIHFFIPSLPLGLDLAADL